MSYSNHNKYHKLLLGVSLLIGVAMIVIGLVFNPSFVAEHLSSDGILSQQNVVKIYKLQSLAIIIGSLALLYLLAKIMMNDLASKIDGKICSYAKKVNDKTINILIHLRFLTKESPALLQTLTSVWIILLLLTLASGIWKVCFEWQNAQGYEYLWIAEGITSGHGFSIAADHRWMFVDFESSYPSDKYFLTALEEPIYPGLLALSFKALGQYGKLGILILQVIALSFTSVAMYFLGRKVFNTQTGILAGFILSIWPASQIFARAYFYPVIFAGLMVTIVAYLIFWCSEKVSVRRGMLLGLMLGISCLTLAATMFFIPISVVLILFLARPFRPIVWKTSLSILFTACIVVAPWTIRNFLVFDQFIPIRTGSGLTTHLGNPILAATFSSHSHACSDELGPLWKAKSLNEAMQLARKNQDKRFAIYKRSFDCIELKAPLGYEKFNEAERDKVYWEQTKEFIYSEPKLFTAMALKKFFAFASGWRSSHHIISFLGLVGALIALRNAKAMALILLALAYALPYSLGMPWYYRYRYPIDPVVLVLTSFAVIFFASKLSEFLLRLHGLPGDVGKQLPK